MQAFHTKLITDITAHDRKRLFDAAPSTQIGFPYQIQQVPAQSPPSSSSLSSSPLVRRASFSKDGITRVFLLPESDLPGDLHQLGHNLLDTSKALEQWLEPNFQPITKKPIDSRLELLKKVIATSTDESLRVLQEQSLWDRVPQKTHISPGLQHKIKTHAKNRLNVIDHLWKLRKKLAEEPLTTTLKTWNDQHSHNPDIQGFTYTLTGGHLGVKRHKLDLDKDMDELQATFYMITKLGYTEGLPKEFKPLTQAWINFTQSLTDITEAINNLKKPKDKENFLDWLAELLLRPEIEKTLHAKLGLKYTVRLPQENEKPSLTRYPNGTPILTITPNGHTEHHEIGHLRPHTQKLIEQFPLDGQSITTVGASSKVDFDKIKKPINYQQKRTNHKIAQLKAEKLQKNKDFNDARIQLAIARQLVKQQFWKLRHILDKHERSISLAKQTLYAASPDKKAQHDQRRQEAKDLYQPLKTLLDDHKSDEQLYPYLQQFLYILTNGQLWELAPWQQVPGKKAPPPDKSTTKTTPPNY